MTDPYEALELALGATADEVRAAHRRLARHFHPDRHATAPPEVQAFAAARMAEINAAYQVLTDPHVRAQFERWRRIRGRPAPPRPVAPHAQPDAQQPGTWDGVRFHTSRGDTGNRDQERVGDPDFDYRRAAASEFTVSDRKAKVTWTAGRPSARGSRLRRWFKGG